MNEETNSYLQTDQLKLALDQLNLQTLRKKSRDFWGKWHIAHLDWFTSWKINTCRTSSKKKRIMTGSFQNLPRFLGRPQQNLNLNLLESWESLVRWASDSCPLKTFSSNIFVSKWNACNFHIPYLFHSVALRCSLPFQHNPKSIISCCRQWSIPLIQAMSGQWDIMGEYHSQIVDTDDGRHIMKMLHWGDSCKHSNLFKLPYCVLASTKWCYNHHIFFLVKWWISLHRISIYKRI
jgi:hypothetical protein